LQIGVIGGRSASKQILDDAFIVGREIAKRGAVLVCGGMGGVMESACRGAKEAGGVTIGIIPTNNPNDANPFIDYVIATDMGFARNALIINSVCGVIAINGKFGTLSEVGFALQKGIPVISLGSWKVADEIIPAETPESAVATLFTNLEKKGMI